MCFIEKILERCVYLMMNEYLINFNIISEFQFGFQKNKSTSDLLSIFSNFINSKLNDNQHVIALFIDFSKAFDTINHSLLISSLDAIGIRGPALSWFMNYLENRHILVKIGSTYSIRMSCDTGVPQGSILGPMLYLIYVNSMINSVGNCQAYMYADDTVLLSSHKDLKVAESNLQQDFNNILKWCHDNELVINASKTKIVHICSPHNQKKLTPINITFHTYNCLHTLRRGLGQCKSCSLKIDTVNTYVYLGITVDRHFTWTAHIDTLCKRLRHCAFSLYKLKFILPSDIMRTVYLALVESILSYGLLSWGNASKTHIEKILSIQNKIITCIASKRLRHIDVSQYYRDINILPISDLYVYRLILKYYFQPEFKIIEDHKVNTRLRLLNNYKIPSFNNKHGKRMLQYNIPEIFNSLPIDLRTFTKYSTLKKYVKEWLLSRNISNSDN